MHNSQWSHQKRRLVCALSATSLELHEGVPSFGSLGMRSPILHSWHVALSLVIVVVVGLFSSPLALVQAQYSSVPLASCPAGYDCVGRQLEPYLGTNNSIDCSNGQFVGYTCAYSGSEALTFCPSGYYCPTPTMQVECPSGHWCHQGSTNPQSQMEGLLRARKQGSIAARLLTPLPLLLLSSVPLRVRCRCHLWRGQVSTASDHAADRRSGGVGGSDRLIPVRSLPLPPACAGGARKQARLDRRDRDRLLSGRHDHGEVGSGSRPISIGLCRRQQRVRVPHPPAAQRRDRSRVRARQGCECDRREQGGAAGSRRDRKRTWNQDHPAQRHRQTARRKTHGHHGTVGIRYEEDTARGERFS